MSASAPPTSLAGPVLIARVVLVIAACGLAAVLPKLFRQNDTEIVSYTAPKEPVRKPPVEPAENGKPGRLWGAIVPQDSELWFFKATGPVDDMARHESEIRAFLQSVKFERGEPKWELPESWQQDPGFDFIFATIHIPAGKERLDLSVSRLPRGDGALDEQLLANINRWRGQISLPPVTLNELAATTERITVSGIEATLLSVEGTLKSRPMGRGPMMR